MKVINPNKIKNARLIRRLSMSQMTARMGEYAVSRMAISKIERGLMQPTEQTLAAIAQACMVPVEYFFKNDLKIGKFEFRFQQNTPAKKRMAIEAQVIAAVQDYMELNNNIPEQISFKNPLKGTTVRNYPDLELAAERIRSKWSIGLQPIFSVYELLQDYGIHIIEIDIDDTCIAGVSTFINGTTPIIIVNSRNNQTTERKRFTALHELAHLLLRLNPISEEEFSAYTNSLPELPYSATLKQPDKERLCECFACAMLLPRQCVFRRFGNSRADVHIDELINVRQKYGISIAATIHRLHTLRIIDDVHYHQYYEEIISPNVIETGLGDFPIKEVADTKTMLQLRLKDMHDTDNIY